MAGKTCSECGGTGWRVVASAGGGGRVAVPCACVGAERDTRARRQARIPPRYEHCDFENFETDLHDQEPDAARWNQSLKRARLVVESFAREYPAASEHGLLLMGPSGVGKTHLAVAALRAVAARGHQGLFYDYRDLLKQIQASYNPESQTTEMDVLEPVLRAEVLLLDDLGASKPSTWALETVGHILNTRYNDKRMTLVTTNFMDAYPQPQPGSPARHEESLADRIGQRIRSRLYEMCRTVELSAPDFRKQFRRAWPGR
ncbi:MAG TPA: ATP-binding protein [Candidatus Acidoferrales bacterium]|nr:ATP-binding protein [Candidatus Acidoferrales bacterium]